MRNQNIEESASTGKFSLDYEGTVNNTKANLDHKDRKLTVPLENVPSSWNKRPSKEDSSAGCGTTSPSPPEMLPQGKGERKG